MYIYIYIYGEQDVVMLVPRVDSYIYICIYIYIYGEQDVVMLVPRVDSHK